MGRQDFNEAIFKRKGLILTLLLSQVLSVLGFTFGLKRIVASSLIKI